MYFALTGLLLWAKTLPIILLYNSLTGWIRDTTGSYQSARELAILILTIGLIALILAHPPVHPSLRENRANSSADQE
jgi:thiosulfate reductase cytochrome b subunit